MLSTACWTRLLRSMRVWVTRAAARARPARASRSRRDLAQHELELLIGLLHLLDARPRQALGAEQRVEVVGHGEGEVHALQVERRRGPPHVRLGRAHREPGLPEVNRGILELEP